VGEQAPTHAAALVPGRDQQLLDHDRLATRGQSGVPRDTPALACDEQQVAQQHVEDAAIVPRRTVAEGAPRKREQLRRLGLATLSDRDVDHARLRVRASG
jgi:hypothetical protein